MNRKDKTNVRNLAVVEEPARLEELLDTSARLFATQGYNGTSLADIASELGINKASLYHYITSKEDLASRLILRGSRRLRLIAHDLYLDSIPATDALCRLVKEHAEVLLEHPYEMGLLITQRQFFNSRALREVTEREAAYVACVRSVIARGVEVGEFRDLDVRVVTQFILDAVNGLLRWYRPHGRLPAEDVIDELWRFIHASIST